MEKQNPKYYDPEQDTEDEIMPEPRKAYWECTECDYESHTKAIPERDKYYAAIERKGYAAKCPKCKSESLQVKGI